jgi:predicted nucleic acid-binding protein
VRTSRSTIRSCARDAAHLRSLEEFLEGLPYLPVDGLEDCLIAAVAIRNDVPVLHNDADFDTLARHTALQIA